MILETPEPGKTKYRVYTKNGALIYVGESAGAAQEMYEIGEQEEEDARKAREASSRRSSD
jgi:hypothetical protein